MSEGEDCNGEIAGFRANIGKVGGMFEGSTLLLLTTIGERTDAGPPESRSGVQARLGQLHHVYDA